MILTAKKLKEAGKIDACIVVSSQHLNWSQNEIPMWYPEAEIAEWLSSKKNFPIIHHRDKRKFFFFCLNHEALQMDDMQNFLNAFTEEYRTLFIVDESHHLKSSRFKRTKTKTKPRARIAREVAKRCPYKRILTGTPDPNGPFDYWSQFYILDPNILGSSSTAFKARYGVFEQGFFGGQRVPVLKGYQNLEELKAKIEPYSYWSDWGNEITKPVFQRQFFEMTPKQEKIYKQLEEEFFIYIDSKECIVDHTLTRVLRLHQLARGFFDGQAIAPECALPALEAAINPGEKTIIWVHFKDELEVISKWLQKHHPDRHMVLDASIKKEHRLLKLKEFNRNPSLNLLLSSPSVVGEGTNISSATHMIFYSNSYDWGEREQALFRFQGDQQKAKQLFVTDMIASHSVDLRCLKAFERKEDLAESFRRKK